MRIGIAQINTTVGDLAGNRRKILDAYAELVARGAQLVVFPELVTCGYPPRDLLFKSRFVPDTQASLDLIASAIGATPALIGTVTPNPAPAGRPFFNAAAFCHRGHVLRIAHKCLLPTYDVFDEDRYFEPAPSPLIVEHAGLRIGITLCEDIWTHPALRTPRPLHHINPVALLAASGVDLMVNLSASPWQQEKETLRLQLVADTARALRAPVVYCNAIGGNDELIFDGRSLTVDAGGRLLARLASFREELRVVDCPLPPPLPLSLDVGCSTLDVRHSAKPPPPPPPPPLPPKPRPKPRPNSSTPSSSACATTRPRAASNAHSSPSPAASTPPSSPRLPPKPSDRTTSPASRFPRPFPRNTRVTTPQPSPATSISITTASTLPPPWPPPKPRSRPSSPDSRATSPRRTFKPASAASS
ncbi:hypothetical protein Ga0100231_015780 [Opitutaceae bacterium TAV4]|nr:hypothetical protein Ga0100231_015780 [Opitutaceae bacterium TAV4]